MPLDQKAGPRDERRAVVLVFRALQVGDILCATPAWRALRQQRPFAEIILVGLPWAAQLLPRYAGLIDRVIRFPGHPDLPEQMPDGPAIRHFYDEVRLLRADLALQLHGSGEVSNAIVECFGARRMVGFAGATTTCKDRLAWPEHGHEIRRCLALVRALGASTDDESLHFPVTADDIAELQRTGLPAALQGQPYVCVHPGARSAARRWPAACFAQVADALAAAGLRVVLTGSGAEAALAEQVRQQMHRPAINAALPCSLGALAALLRDAVLLVCNDTGVSHLAAALRLRSVVVFTGSDPERWAPLDTSLHCSIVDSEGRRAAEVAQAAMRLLAPACMPSRALIRSSCPATRG